MMLFKKEFIPHIVGQAEPKKTATRRLGKRRWNIGAIHTFKTNYNNDSIFARGKILAVYPQNLFDMNEDDAFKEGFWSLKDFKKAWIKINGSWVNKRVWVVDFVTVESFVKPIDTVPLSKFFKIKE